MEEIKVGEYVRTIDGNIGKIEQINKEPTDDNVIYAVTDNWVGMYEEIVKHSPNIIDLVQEGDYIQLEDRGERFYEVTTDYQGKLAIIDIGWNEYEEIDETYNQNIKSIVTHEQFNQVKYEV